MTDTWRQHTSLMADLRARVARSSVLAGVVPNAPVPSPLAAPRSWFDVPPTMVERASAGGATPFTVVLDGPDAGRVYGDVAPRGQCILDGRPGCWTVPGPDQDDLSMSMNGVYETAEGDTIAVGVIPMDCNHAPDGTAAEAIDYMAHSGQMLAIVRYVHTPTSIAACGVLAPGITWSDAVRARAAAQSGDWRALLSEIRFDDGRPPEFRFTGSVTVNVPGLPLAVRLAAARRPTSVHGPALITQEAPMTVDSHTAAIDPETIAEIDAALGLEPASPVTDPAVPAERKAGVVYVLKPRPVFQVNDEVFFAGGARHGMVVSNGVDAAGGPLVTVREAFEDGTLADPDLDVTVPEGDCTSTGRMFDYEDYVDGVPDIAAVAAAADAPVVADAPHPCSCQTAAHTAADMGGPPAAPVVEDPTNDILLERLDAIEKAMATFNERLDTVENSIAVSNDVAQVAAQLGVA